MIKEIVSKLDWGLVGLWALVVVFLFLLVYMCLCIYHTEKERERVLLMREIRDALPWADPVKVIMDAEYAPIFMKNRR